MAEDTPAALRERLMGALLAPDAVANGAAVLTLAEGPIAVLEVPDKGAAIVILEADDPREVVRQCGELFHRHGAGTLFVVAAGGGADVRAALVEADRTAPDQKTIGVYHLDAHGVLSRVAGRKLSVLDSAAPTFATAKPLRPDQIPALIAQGQRERQEAVAFAEAQSSRHARVTWTLVGVCVLIHVALSSRFGGPTWGLALVLSGANSAPLVHEGQWWRLLSHAFLHGNAQHLAMNMIALWSFGTFLERVVGWRRYVVLYVLAALGGGVASALIGGHELSVGASGAVWGLMAAGFGLVVRRGVLPVRVTRVMRQRLVVVLVLNALISFVPGIDLYAHFGGGLVGFALVLTGVLVPMRDPEPRSVTGAAYAAIVVAVLALALAFGTGRPWEVPADAAASLSGGGAITSRLAA